MDPNWNRGSRGWDWASGQLSQPPENHRALYVSLKIASPDPWKATQPVFSARSSPTLLLLLLFFLLPNASMLENHCTRTVRKISWYNHGCIVYIRGITITENIDWCQNISDISSKAGVLRRLHTRVRVAYITLVRPKLEYEAPIWSPYCKTQIHQVEKVQRTVACWTCRRVAQH